MQQPVLNEKQQAQLDIHIRNAGSNKKRLRQCMEAETDKLVCKALACYFLDKFPKDVLLLKIAAATLGNFKMHPEAAELFEVAHRLDPADMHTVSEHCRSLHFLHRHEELLRVSEQYLPQPDKEDHAQLLYWKSTALLSLGRTAESIEPGLEAAELWPDNFWLLFNIGYAYYAQKDYERALRYYNDTIRVKPGFRIPYLNKACVYSLLGKYQESFLCLMQLYDMDKPYFRSALSDEELEGLMQSEFAAELKRLAEPIPVVDEEDLDDGDDD